MENTNTTYNNHIEEDEIDLRELWQTIMKHKFKIIFFSFFITLLTLIYALSLPNSYKSAVLLSPQEQAKPSLGGLASLAGMAGIDIGGSNADIVSVLQATFKDYGFEVMMINKYHLDKKLLAENLRKNMVFALNYSGIYDTLHSPDKNRKQKSKEQILFDTYKKIQKVISVSSDKKTSLITLSAVCEDRFLSKWLVQVYLKELTSFVKTREMKDTDKKIRYYKNELKNTTDITLKTQISNLIATLMQKKVLSQASEYYNVSIVTDPVVANIKDKTKPKRALILVVALITSIILSIFLVFFIEFLKSNKDEKENEKDKQIEENS